MSYKNLSPGEVKGELNKLERSPSCSQKSSTYYRSNKSKPSGSSKGMKKKK